MPVYAVEIPLRSDELSGQMVAMRMWLDKERVEPWKFSCRESEYGILIRVEFRCRRRYRRASDDIVRRGMRRSRGEV